MLDSVCNYYGKERLEIDGKEYVVTDDYKKLVKEKKRKEYCLKKINEMYPSITDFTKNDYDLIVSEMLLERLDPSEVLNKFYNKLLKFLQRFAKIYAKTDLPKNLFKDALEECYCELLNNIFSHIKTNNWFKDELVFNANQYRITSYCLECFQKENANELYCKVKHYWTGEEEITSLITKDDFIKDYPNSYNLLELLYNNGTLKKIAKERFDELDEDAVAIFDEETIKQFDQSLLKEVLNGVLHTLTQREEMILRYRYGLDNDKPHTLLDTAKEFGMTRDNIRYIEAKALRKLRHPFRSKQLKDFVEY